MRILLSKTKTNFREPTNHLKAKMPRCQCAGQGVCWNQSSSASLEGRTYDKGPDEIMRSWIFFWSSRARLLRLLLPGGIIPGGLRVTFSFGLRSYMPTHLAIPAGQFSIPCVVPWCHRIVIVLSGPALPSNPPPWVEGLIRTTPYSTPNTGGSIPGEQNFRH